jgi:gliding motility-associated-like protein
LYDQRLLYHRRRKSPGTGSGCNGRKLRWRTVLNGSGNYAYDWDDDQYDGQEDLSDLDLTTGCTHCYTIEEENPLELEADVTGVSCDGSTLGSIDLTVLNGSGNYAYDWDDDQYDGQEDLSDLPLGTYCVTVTDLTTGCTVEDCYTIEEENPLELEADVTGVSCDGGTLGSIDLTVLNGSGNYAYDWDDDQYDGQEDLSDLPLGTYCVTVTDLTTGCTVEDCYTIEEENPLELEADVTGVSCDGGTLGSIDLTVLNGSGNYAYDWDDDQYDGQEDLSDLPLGTYCVTVTDLTTGCTVEDCYTIEEENPLELEADVTGVSCDGGTLGSIDLTVLNGSGNYAYDWDDDQYDGQEDLSDLPLGTYCVTVTDLTTGCTVEDCYTIEEENPLELEADVTGVSCDGGTLGSIDLTVLNGSGNYAYDWDDDQYDGQEDLSDLPLGTYCVTVTDLTTGCTVEDCYTIEEENPLELEADVTGVSCDGTQLGSIDLTVLNGSGNYAYDWDDDQYDGQEDLSDLPLGTYCVTVTDLTTGCTVEDCYTIEEENPLETEILVTPEWCEPDSNGTITIVVSGGSGTYQYEWAPMVSDTAVADSLPVGSYMVTITDLNTSCTLVDTIEVPQANEIDISGEVTNIPCDLSALGAIDVTVTGTDPTAIYNYDWDDDQYDGLEDLTDLPEGTYILTVTDNFGCTAVDTFMVIIEGTIELDTLITNASCLGIDDGAIEVIPLTGTPPYTIEWSDPSLDGQFNPTGLSSGNYSLTVTDALGCFQSLDLFIDVEKTLELNPTITQVDCHGDSTGSIALTVTGGTEPYMYLWEADPLNDSPTLDDLPAGSYPVTVTDAEGCIAIDTFVVNENPAIEITADITNTSCPPDSNGMIVLTIEGGVSPYTVLWSMGDTTTTVDSLTTGDYTVTVTDALGCSEELTATVGADSSPLADFSWGFQTCTQDSVVIVFQDESTDPSGILDWQWVFNETDTFLIQDPVYTVYADTNLIVELTVTSGDGCIGTKTDTVPVDLVEVFLMDTVICLGDSVGLNPLGDTSYQYLWFPGELFDDPTQVNPIVSPDSTTNYQVLITGISGDTCQIIELITVTVADLMVINLPPDTLTCEEEITLQASVQNADFFAWFNENGQIISFADTVTVTPEDTSYYIIAALDTNSCFASDTVAVIEGKTDLSLADTFVVCLGNSVTLDIVNSDPDDIYVYDWKPEDLLNMDSIPNPVFTPDSLGSYVFTATAVNQYECDWIDSTTVIVIDSSSTGDFLVFGQCEELTMNFINGNAPYYKLCYGVGDSCSTNKITSFVYPDTGTYTVMLIKTDPNIICSPDTIFKDIQVLEAPFLSLVYDWEFEECGDSALIAFFDQSIHVNDEIVRWEWVFVSDNLGDTLSTSMLQNPLVEVQESDSLYITLFVTTRVGCEGVLRDTLPIELIDVSLPDTLFICPGDTTTLGLVPGADDYTFLWTPNEFISDPTAENPEVYPPVTTTYIVEVTDLVPDTCSIERSVTVVVLPPLALSVSQDVIQCSDTLVPISASSPGAEISYEWSTSPDFDPIIGVTSEILAMPGDPIAIYYVRTTDNQTGCQALASVQVANYEVDIDLIGDTLICLDQSAIISVVPGMEGDSLGLQYEWTSTDPGFPGSSDSTISVSPANSAWYNVVASNGFCIGEDSLQLIVDTFATTAQLFLDRDTLYKGEMAILEATAIGNNISYDWTPRDGLSDPTSSITEASPEVTTEYSVLITNEDTQCATVRDTLITVLESVCGRPNIFLPNAFTPNDDNVNDVLFLRAVNVTSVYLAVYNRWGQLIFETDSLDRGWDGTFKGKELDPDVYGYYFEVDCLGGQNYFEKGNVTLIR